MALKLPIFLFTILISLNVYSTQAPVKTLKGKLYKFQKSVKNIRHAMKSLDSDIHSKNKRLVNVLQKKTLIQNEIIEMEHNYQETFEEYKSRKNEIKQDLKKLAIQQENQKEKIGQFFKLVILKKRLLKKLNKIKTDENHLASLRNEILDEQKRLEGLEKFETDINVKIIALESKQQKYMSDYQDRLGVATELSKKIKEELSKMKEIFGEPIKEYVSKTHKKNQGIYFTVKGRKEVQASKGGKVIYVGSMSNYGNIVMIQHGNEKISVYLGQFNPKVKIQTELRKGEVIGYTDLIGDKTGNIYFEIRHKNVPQNTLALLNKV